MSVQFPIGMPRDSDERNVGSVRRTHGQGGRRRHRDKNRCADGGGLLHHFDGNAAGDGDGALARIDPAARERPCELV